MTADTSEYGETPIRARACGKAILVGEHAVLYGAQAVAIPLPEMEMRLAMDTRNASPDEDFLRVRLGGAEVSASVLSAAHDALRILSLPTPRGTIEGESQLWMGAGLGSSAALSVALIRLFCEWKKFPMAPEEVMRCANIIEERFHGKPSGLDVAVVAWERPIAFRRGAPPEPLTIQSPRGGRWHFVIMDSHARASTKTMVEKSSAYFRGDGAAERVANFDRLAAQAMAALTAGDPVSLAIAMGAAQQHLRDAGVVGPELQTCVDLAHSVGCLAAKVTGAGGGGAVLALLSEEPLRAEAQFEKIVEKWGAAHVHRVSL